MRTHNWVFTINNYTDEQQGSLRAIHEHGRARYIIWGREIGANGTPHLQGYICFRDAHALGAASRAIPHAHLEPRRGTHEEARAYCTKEGDFEELGTAPAQGTRTDVTRFIELARTGANDLVLSEHHPVEFLKFYRAADRIRSAVAVPRQEKTVVHWYYGATGTGKSRTACEENPGAFWKDMSIGTWWDGYDGQDAVVFDDMRKDTFKFHELLRLFDRYPLSVQVKGGYRQFNSKKIVVTCCISPDDMYGDRKDEDIAQLMRRIEVKRFFP